MKNPGEKKILLVGPVPPPYGGQSALVNSILESNLAVLFKFSVLNITHGRPGLLKRAALSIYFLLRMVVSLVAGKGIKIVHVHTSAGAAFYEKSLFSLLGKLFGKKVILHIHGGRFKQFWGESGWLGKFFIRRALNINDCLIVLSYGWKAYFENEVKCKARIQVLGNAVKGARLGHERTPSSEVTFLYVGHLKREKGLLDLLDAVCLLQHMTRMRVKVKLMGVGDTPENENTIRSAFAASGVENVEFLGLLSGEEKRRQFANSDVFVLPSHSEDMPLSILEAMSYGLPVIATNVGAIPEVIENGINGYLVNPNDVDSLTEKMKLVAENSVLRKTIGTTNIKKVLIDYSFENFERKLGKLYAELLPG